MPRRHDPLRIFLRNIYGYTFFTGFLVVLPVYSIFMQSHGVSDFGLSMLLIVWVLGVVLAQIPVARIAAKFGPRFTLVLGQMLLAVGYGLWALAPNTTGFVLGMFLVGVQGAIYNVVPESLIYNEVSAQHHTAIYEWILGCRRNFMLVGNIVAMGGSLLVGLGYNILTILSVVSIAISAIFVLFLRIDAPDNLPQSVAYSMHDIGQGFKMLRTNKNFMLFVLLNVLVVNLAYLNDFVPVIGFQIGIPLRHVGVVPVFLLCAQMLGHAIAHRFKFLPESLLYFLIMLGGLLFVMFASVYSVIGLLLLGISYAIFGVVKILLYSKMQASITAQNRLVGLSFYNIASQAFYGITCLILGLGSDGGSWRYGILPLGGLLILVGFVPMLWHQNK